MHRLRAEAPLPARGGDGTSPAVCYLSVNPVRTTEQNRKFGPPRRGVWAGILKPMESSTTSLVIPSGDVGLAARLHGSRILPAERRPTVIVVGSWLTVKEQMADLYARPTGGARLSRPHVRLQRVRCQRRRAAPGGAAEPQDRRPARRAPMGRPSTTLAPLRRRSGSSPCAPAPSTPWPRWPDGLPVAAFGQRRRAGSTTPSRWPPFYGGPDGVRQRIERSDEAAERFFDDGETVMVPAYDPDDERGGDDASRSTTTPRPDRGAVAHVAQRDGRVVLASLAEVRRHLTAAAVDMPTLLVHSDDAVLPDNVRSSPTGWPDRSSSVLARRRADRLLRPAGPGRRSRSTPSTPTCATHLEGARS